MKNEVKKRSQKRKAARKEKERERNKLNAEQNKQFCKLSFNILPLLLGITLPALYADE
jgi:hypothetical protein